MPPVAEGLFCDLLDPFGFLLLLSQNSLSFPMPLVFGLPSFRLLARALVNVDNPPAENGTRRFRGKEEEIAGRARSSGLVGVSDRCALTSMWTRDSLAALARRCDGRSFMASSTQG